jgi:hypothetical protein
MGLLSEEHEIGVGTVPCACPLVTWYVTHPFRPYVPPVGGQGQAAVPTRARMGSSRVGQGQAAVPTRAGMGSSRVGQGQAAVPTRAGGGALHDPYTPLLPLLWYSSALR